VHLVGEKLDPKLMKVPLPSCQFVHAEGKMIPAIEGDNRINAISDKVQLLLAAKPEPRAWKIERGTWHGFQEQKVPIKLTALLNIACVNRNVIQFEDFHFRDTGCSNRMSALSRFSSSLKKHCISL
jgi:hypothetical protein